MLYCNKFFITYTSIENFIVNGRPINIYTDTSIKRESVGHILLIPDILYTTRLEYLR